MLAAEPAICKKCGNKQFYTKVITWNTWLNPEYPAHNKCYKCGEEITYNDIDLSSCSPKHREEVRYGKIHTTYNSKIKDKSESNNVCPECGSEMCFALSCGIKLPEKYKDNQNYSVEKRYHICNECGYKKYQTVEEITASGLYEFVENGTEEHEYIVKKSDNYQEIIQKQNEQFAKELEQIENELISEGLISTREEEQEYIDNYYNKNDEVKYEI